MGALISGMIHSKRKAMLKKGYERAPRPSKGKFFCGELKELGGAPGQKWAQEGEGKGTPVTYNRKKVSLAGLPCIKSKKGLGQPGGAGGQESEVYASLCPRKGDKSKKVTGGVAKKTIWGWVKRNCALSKKGFETKAKLKHHPKCS